MPKLTGAVLFTIVFLLGNTAWAGGAVQIASEVPYNDPTTVDHKIINECTAIGTKLGTFLNKFATDMGVQTVIVDKVNPKADGRALVVKITNAFSAGNAFMGHRKSMSVKVELFENGKSLGHTNFSRDSSGGFAGGYKGSCAVLGRCTKALGKDIAKWLAKQS